MSEQKALLKVREFVLKARRLIENISAEDLVEKGGANPYMAKALGMRTIDEVVEFFVSRRIERSLGTSFGNVLDEVIRILLGGLKGKELVKKYGKWIKWWDIVLPDKKIVISVKSGPADMDKDQVEYFVERAREAESNGFQPFLVFVYGKQAFPIIENYLIKGGYPPKKHLRIGKAVFEEFLVDSAYYKKALEIFSTAGEETGDLFALIEAKIKAITEELKRKYGDDVDKLIEDMF